MKLQFYLLGVMGLGIGGGGGVLAQSLTPAGIITSPPPTPSPTSISSSQITLGMCDATEDFCGRSKTTTTRSTSVSGCPRSICADYINECGEWYGGCLYVYSIILFAVQRRMKKRELNIDFGLLLVLIRLALAGVFGQLSPSHRARLPPLLPPALEASVRTM
ncbi:hypothetical protein L873DRAFT_899495 [Choiromyces venosus 120613-1]|uniref:Uncharacterized protein n=1 Tax=Choiromyces venosus 120613-1 TaxID=1336337 RepID=A0A3N4JQW1_9PEZI|nr:hypothetical protein L873DRAFT_899495 [Choiromyces venosus 120613-1]